MSLLIESIINEIADQNEAEKQKLRQKYQDLLGEARIELQKVLEQVTGLYETLKPFIIENFDLGKHYQDVYIQLDWTIQSDELQLAPIRLSLRHPRMGYHTGYIKVAGRDIDYASVQQAIAYARADFARWRKETDDKFVDERKQKFYFWGQRDEQVMQSTYDAIVARLPERQAEFDKLRQGWLETRSENEKREAEEEGQRQEVKKAKEEYLAQMIAYYQQHYAISNLNTARSKAIQTALDQPFDAWHLIYALVSNVDGEAYVETADRWVTTEQPDANGYWTTFNGEQIIYFYPVSIKKVTARPSDGITGLYKNIIRSKYGLELFAQRSVDEADVDRQIVELGCVELPEKPSRPEILNWPQGESIEREAWRAAYEPDEADPDEIAF